MKLSVTKVRAAAVAVAMAAMTTAGMGVAQASSAHSGTCSAGTVSGTYWNLTVKGDCRVPDGARLTVQGDLVLAQKAAFHGSTHSTITIRGNVLAARGSVFELGCTPAHPCDAPDGTPFAGGPGKIGADSVGGDVVLKNVYNAAINGVRIGGNLFSTGGGPGLKTPGVNFSVKDDRVGGDIIVTGLDTFWFGIIRTYVGGNVVLRDIGGSNPDSNELATNHIRGNLSCSDNHPKPQLGDATQDPTNGPNVVGGRASGQCAGLDKAPKA